MRVNKEVIQKNLKEDIFVKISEASDDLGVDSYVVGGYVRDLCLRRPVKKDIDVMCVGSGIELAQNFYKRIKSENLVWECSKKTGKLNMMTKNEKIDSVL